MISKEVTKNSKTIIVLPLDDYLVGGSSKVQMDDPGIQRSIFKAKHDGSIDYSINQKTSVQDSSKDKNVPYRELDPGL